MLAGNNPYSEVVIPVAGGDWQAGDVLVGNWNDPTNTFFGTSIYNGHCKRHGKSHGARLPCNDSITPLLAAGQGNTLTLIRGAAAIKTYTFPEVPHFVYVLTVLGTI